jgi:hypothetical protein
VQDGAITFVARLVTFVDIDEADGAAAEGLSFSARQDALLSDGRRLVLLNGRGWNQTKRFARHSELPTLERRSSSWKGITREGIEGAARSVVGPDSAYKKYTQAEANQGHWAHLSATLAKEGIHADATALEALPHDVELSARLLSRLDDPPEAP